MAVEDDDPELDFGVSTPRELAELIDGLSGAEIEAALVQVGVDRALDRIFQGMVDHFLTDKAGWRRAVVEFVIAIPDGERTYQFVADRKGAAWWEGRREKPSAKISVRLPDFLRMVAGRLDGVRGFVQGRVKVKGNLLLARKIQGWFDMSR